jgi:hypothetical protein
MRRSVEEGGVEERLLGSRTRVIAGFALVSRDRETLEFCPTR